VEASAHLSSEVVGHPPTRATPESPRRRELRRGIVVGPPLVYVVALVVFVLSWGLPVARDQLFLWVLLGLAAFSVGAWRSWGAMLLAWVPWLGLLVVYDELRGAVSVIPAGAHVAPQIAFDRWVGGGVVPTLQTAQGLASEEPGGRQQIGSGGGCQEGFADGQRFIELAVACQRQTIGETDLGLRVAAQLGNQRLNEIDCPRVVGAG